MAAGRKPAWGRGRGGARGGVREGQERGERGEGGGGKGEGGARGKGGSEEVWTVWVLENWRQHLCKRHLAAPENFLGRRRVCGREGSLCVRLGRGGQALHDTHTNGT